MYILLILISQEIQVTNKIYTISPIIQSSKKAKQKAFKATLIIDLKIFSIDFA